MAAKQSAEHSIRYDANSNAYTLQATGAHTTTYMVDLDDADVQQGLLRISASVDRGPFFVVLAKAGIRYRDSQGAIIEPAL